MSSTFVRTQGPPPGTAWHQKHTAVANRILRGAWSWPQHQIPPFVPESVCDGWLFHRDALAPRSTILLLIRIVRGCSCLTLWPVTGFDVNDRFGGFRSGNFLRWVLGDVFVVGFAGILGLSAHMANAPQPDRLRHEDASLE
jgi:hypothetical protein